MKVPVKGETECDNCMGYGHVYTTSNNISIIGNCPECNGKGKIPTLTFRDYATEQINQWYNGR